MGMIARRSSKRSSNQNISLAPHHASKMGKSASGARSTGWQLPELGHHDRLRSTHRGLSRI
jgi:hypothetical protein